MKVITSIFLEENNFSQFDYNGKLCFRRSGFIVMSDNGIWYPCNYLGAILVIGEIYLKTENDLIKLFEESTGIPFLKE